MSKQLIEMYGEVVETLSHSKHIVKLEINDEKILGYVTGNMIRKFVRVHKGDRVKVELSPYDIRKENERKTGRIVFRYNTKKNESKSIYKKKK